MRNDPNLAPNLAPLFGLHHGLDRCVTKPIFLVLSASAFRRTGWFRKKRRTTPFSGAWTHDESTDSECNHTSMQTGCKSTRRRDLDSRATPRETTPAERPLDNKCVQSRSGLFHEPTEPATQQTSASDTEG